MKMLISCAMALSVVVNSWAVEPPERGRDVVYVDNVQGSDDCDGRSRERGEGTSGPFATIARAVEKVGVSGAIEIVNTGRDYREHVSISGVHKGLADAPLSLNGNGAYINGLVQVPAASWRHLRDDIYYFLNEKVSADSRREYGTLPSNVWLRTQKGTGWFQSEHAPRIFFLDGVAVPNVASLDTMTPGSFFYDTRGSALTAPAGRPCIYLRLPAGKTLADCVVELPLSGGVYVGDDFVTVKNLGSRYSVEDGFDGFWGQGVVFQNIHACENTEQGVSFHGNGTTLIDGALIERNGGCGIVDVMSSTTVYRRVTVRQNFPNGVQFRGFAHAMYDCQVVENRGNQVESSNRAAISLTNCLIVGNGPEGTTAGVMSGYGRIDHCTIVNTPIGILATSGLQVTDSIVTGTTTLLQIMPKAVDSFSVTSSLLHGGAILLGDTRIAQPAEAEGLKKFTGLVFDSPELDGPLFQLPAGSPLLKAGTNGSPLGATRLSLLENWSVPQ